MNNYMQSVLPTNDEEKLIVSTELLVLSVQVALQKSMIKQGVSSADLASRLGMSPGRVSQIFSEKGPNLTLKTIARVAAALGEDFEFLPRNDPKLCNALFANSAWHEGAAANEHQKPKSSRNLARIKKPQNTIAVWSNGSLQRRAA